MKSKCTKSLMPIAFNVSTVLAKFVRWISGTELANISF